MKITLRNKINAAILITFLLIAVLFTAIELPFQQQRMDAAQKKVEILLKSLVERDQQPLANEIFEGRREAIRIRLAQMLKVDGVLAITVYDAKGTALESAGPAAATDKLSPQQMQVSAPALQTIKGLFNNQSALIYLHPIDVIGERIGFVRISYSLIEIERDNRQALLIFGALLGSILLLMLLVLNTILSRLVIHPITSLRDAMQRMRSNELGNQVPISSPDEIGDLSRAFNRMSADLGLSYQQIQDQNQELRESELRLVDERERLDVTLRSIGDGVIATDVGARVVLMNHTAAELTGHSVEEALGQSLTTIFEVIADDTGARVENPIGEVLKTGQVTSHGDHTTLIARDGTRRAISLGSAPIIDNRQQTIGVILVFQDVTRKRQLEEEMSQMRVYLKNIIDSMPSMLISVNDAGLIVEWNEAASRITGISSLQAIGREFWKVLPALDKYRNYVQEVITSRLPMEFHREAVQDGEFETYHHVSLFPLIANCVQGIVIRIDDITELEKKEQQLRQAQKMETIGTLAGGLAHDFNNLLGGVTGSLSLIKFKLQNEEEVDRVYIKKYLNIMEDSGKRAVDLVKQLLSLSRQQETNLEPVDLNASIEHVMKICANSFDKSIELAAQYAEEKALVMASPTQMEQVLLNLCINAAHALTSMRKEDEPQGGKLTVTLRKMLADKGFCINHPEAKESDYWVLSVHDTGVGMDTKTAAKIFDPFFTTKQKDKGTGLGLAMVYNIIQQHEGFLDVYSEVDLGTNFNIYLPVYHGAIKDIQEEQEIILPHGDGLILVVDDEEIIRQTAKAILEECGFEVILAHDGEEGVRLYRERHQEIKIVLLDMVMPKKSGKEAFLEMQGINPQIKVLLASGFKQDERVDSVLDLGVRGFVQKPYSLEILSEAVFKILDT